MERFRHVESVNLKSMAWSCLCLNSMVRGYHEYQAIWSDPYVGEELISEREVGNSHDPQAVALKKEIDGDLRVVVHVPRRISSSCSIFIRRGGSIKCSITGSRRYSSDLPQGGLEIPCILMFTTKCAELRDKTKTFRSLCYPSRFVKWA